MTARRLAFQVVVIVTALLVQVCVLDRLRLPGGHPDLPVIVVIAFALVGGRQSGAVVGFVTGLAVDLLPPADHLAGMVAFAYTIVGYLAGMLVDIEESSVLTTVAAVAAGAGAAVVIYAAVGSLIGDARITPHAIVHAVIAVVVYDVVLAPFVVPLVSSAMRRLEPAGPR